MMMMMTIRSPAQDIPDIYWEQAARELDFCTCRKCQVLRSSSCFDFFILILMMVVDCCHHGIYEELDNSLDSEKSTQITNHHNSRPATGHTLIIISMIIPIIIPKIFPMKVPKIVPVIKPTIILFNKSSNDNSKDISVLLPTQL